MANEILPYLEWEVLREPVMISKMDDTKELPTGQKIINIKRNEQYKLLAKLSWKNDITFFRKTSGDATPSGSFIEFFDINGLDENGAVSILESCYFGSIRNKWSSDEKLFEADLLLHGLRIKHKSETNGVWLTEWYINGPRDFIFHNFTKRKQSETLFRERLSPENEIIDSLEISGGSSESDSLDFLKIKTNDNEFLVTKVPNEIGPNWSSNIGIEYNKKWGRIPNANEREKIGEFCSFIFGRQLLSVGYSIYDIDRQLVEEFARNPWGNNISSICSKADRPPIRIDAHSHGMRADELISKLLYPYYEMREPFNLKDALWLYWIAHDMPVGTDLPLFASAVEIIMIGWFESTKTKSHGMYLDMTEFEALLQDEINIIREKLKEKPNAEKIMKNLKGANRMGMSDKFRFFFEEIGLVLEEKEWSAIGARHKVAHGYIGKRKEEVKDLIKHSRTYETLIHKIILKLLQYSGSYIDRSEIGWKDKQLI